MSTDLNVCIFTGNLTRDPERRVTPKGVSVTTFGLAVHRTYTTDEGPVDETDFIEVKVWGASADAVAEHLSVGSKIALESVARFEQWEQQETRQKRSRIVFEARPGGIKFLDGKPQESAEPTRN